MGKLVPTVDAIGHPHVVGPCQIERRIAAAPHVKILRIIGTEVDRDHLTINI